MMVYRETAVTGGSIVHTWAERVETGACFFAGPLTRLSAMLRLSALASPALCAVATRDTARVPVRPVTEPSVHYAITTQLNRLSSALGNFKKLMPRCFLFIMFLSYEHYKVFVDLHQSV